MIGGRAVSARSYLSIGDVLTLLRQEFPDVTISKIRFLESQGLVNPERTPSGYRKFYEHDVERLRWVLRQQREHFLPAQGDQGPTRRGRQRVGRLRQPPAATASPDGRDRRRNPDRPATGQSPDRRRPGSRARQLPSDDRAVGRRHPTAASAAGPAPPDRRVRASRDRTAGDRRLLGAPVGASRRRSNRRRPVAGRAEPPDAGRQRPGTAPDRASRSAVRRTGDGPPAPAPEPPRHARRADRPRPDRPHAASPRDGGRRAAGRSAEPRRVGSGRADAAGRRRPRRVRPSRVAGAVAPASRSTSCVRPAGCPPSTSANSRSTD